MSMPRDEMIRCRCGKEFEITVWDSINTQLPNVAERLMTRDLFRIQCPHCGSVGYIEYDTLYNDMEHDRMIYLLHNEDSWAQAVAMFKKLGEADSDHLRIVSDSFALAEKVTALEYGRDDRLIELCKMFASFQLSQSVPSFEAGRVVYCVGDDEKEYLSFMAENGEERLSPFDEALETVYKMMKEHCLEIIEKEYADHYVFDLDWAYDFFNEHEGLFR